MALVGLWSHLIFASAAFYYAPTGAVELASVHDVVAVQTSPSCLDSYLSDAGLAPSAAEVLWGDYQLIHEPNFGKLYLDGLQNSCPETKRLAIYRRYANGAYYLSDGLLRVRFNPRTPFERIQGIMSELSAKTGKPIHRSNIVAFEATSPMDTLRLSRAFMMIPDVEWAVPDFIYKTSCNYMFRIHHRYGERQ